MAQDGFGPAGSEFDIAGALAGDQQQASIAVGTGGGYVVWQDNAIDGDGLGIGARRLDGTLSAVLSAFRVNNKTVGDQRFPQVALTKDGGAVFVWQGGTNGFSGIYGRLLSPQGTFAAPEFQINTFANGLQTRPVVAVLADGALVVAWTSYGQDGSMDGVYAQRLSAHGAKLGTEFRINLATQLNQRNPAVCALKSGGFAVVWISEKAKGTTLAIDQDGKPVENGGAQLFDVGLYGSIFDRNGMPQRQEIRLDGGANQCGTPTCAANANGGFTVVWSERSGVAGVASTLMADVNSWDIQGRSFGPEGSPVAASRRLNTHTYGDQIYPKLATLANYQLAVWTSLGQDGSFEGVFGRALSVDDASVIGAELAVNSHIRGPQLQPTVAADGSDRFVAVWSSLVSVTDGYDLAAQRYAVVDMLPVPGRPYASALSQSRVSVTWPALAGYVGVKYLLYVDGAGDPVEVEGNSHVVSQLGPATSHSFQLAYRLADGQRSALSEITTTSTWGNDENFDGLPDDWQARFWGSSVTKWPGGNLDNDGDGASNLQEFLAGTNPADDSSVLRLQLTSSPQGSIISWNTEPGSIYQVQFTSDFASWVNASGLRLATGGNDSIPAVNEAGVSYYRVVRQR